MATEDQSLEKDQRFAQEDTVVDHVCSVCAEKFTSKSQLFKHLTGHGVETKFSKLNKVVLLVGWVSKEVSQLDIWLNDQIAWDPSVVDKTGGEVEDAVLAAISLVAEKYSGVAQGEDRLRGFSRGSGLYRLTLDSWLKALNDALPSHVRVLEGYFLNGQASRDFHAETDCTQRRYECLLPLDMIMPPDMVSPTEPIVRRNNHRVTSSHLCNGAAMDASFPVDTEEGQRRVHFFRRLKTVFKTLLGKHRVHNFVTGGATAADSVVARRVDRIFHQALVSIEGREFVVFSVSGDSLLRGQVRKMLAAALLVAMQLLPDSFLEAALTDELTVDVPALPGWCVYLAECRYANWEAKHTDYRLDSRRHEGGGMETEAMRDWTARIHAHIAALHRSFPEWMLPIRTHAAHSEQRLATLQRYLSRSEDDLRAVFEKKFGTMVFEEPQITEALEIPDADQPMEEESPVVPEAVVDNPTKGESEPQSKSEKKKKSKSRGLKQASSKRADAVLFRQQSMQIRFLMVSESSDDCPPEYRRVLHLLRIADRSGLWPSSSTGRQVVISAGSLVERGGRGGSFSVGRLPPHLPTPKGNELFPELMHAAFELERVLVPERAPSATIAINRHAQFLPHRDTGAGAGQTCSLIVSLGLFSGGELVADGSVHDIRYQPLQFDGWKSIHQTLPFVGERYSLVWFTPLGCEQMIV